MATRLSSFLSALLVLPTCFSLTLLKEQFHDSKFDLYPVCTSNGCGSYSSKYIQYRFPGIFSTKEELESKQLVFAKMRKAYLLRQGVESIRSDGDGDACCPTDIQMHINYTMHNVYGTRKYIVHMPPKYQHIPHGVCLEPGTCGGICAIEPMTYTLLTFNPFTVSLELDQFIVPGYCSCKNT